MTKRELAKIARAVADRVPACVPDGNLLVIPPIEHSIRGVLLGRSGAPRLFYAHVFLQPLYIPAQDNYVLNLGWRLGGASRAWEADDPKLIDDLASMMIRDALPFLKPIESPADVVKAVRSLHKDADFYVQQALAFGLAKTGSIIEAVDRLEKLAGTLNCDDGWQGQLRRNCELLRDLLVSRPAAAQAQLRAWEVENARILRPKALEPQAQPPV